MREITYDATTKMYGEFPKIVKKGAVSPNGETSVFVWKGRLMRLENDDPSKCYAADAPIRALIRDWETGEVLSRFGGECIFYSLSVQDDVVYVTGSKRDSMDTILIQESRDLIHWSEPRVLLQNPGWIYCNTELVKGEDGYVILMEAESRGVPEEISKLVGHFYTFFFATSKDLVNWTHLDPTKCCYHPDRYCGAPWMTYSNGWFYVIALVEMPGPIYTNYLVRTKDFETWYMGKYNPILMPGNEDRLIHEKASGFTPEFLEEMKTGYISNNSDLDLCEFEGKTIINYSVGNQLGFYYQALAEYNGPLAEFLSRYFDD